MDEDQTPDATETPILKPRSPPSELKDLAQSEAESLTDLALRLAHLIQSARRMHDPYDDFSHLKNPDFHPPITHLPPTDHYFPPAALDAIQDILDRDHDMFLDDDYEDEDDDFSEASGFSTDHNNHTLDSQSDLATETHSLAHFSFDPNTDASNNQERGL